MNKNLPFFKYNPNVYEHEIVEHKSGVCQCCGQPTDVYVGHMYSKLDVDCICMRCISDGSASKKFDGDFVQSYDYSITDAVKIDELIHRTPGYISWQGENWLACCDDFCKFIGEVGEKELNDLKISDDVVSEAGKRYGTELNRSELEKQGSVCGYLFQCLHCGKYHLDFDCD